MATLGHTPLKSSKLPQHIGIIMDGNGRWAEQQGKPRTAGHSSGTEAAKRVIKAAIDLGISYITLYTFSTENWSRSTKEVNFLMKLLRQHLRRDSNFYHSNEIKVLHAGALEGLPQEIQKELLHAQEATKEYQTITAILAINYGGRDEIVRAVNKWQQKTSDPEQKITIEEVGSHLDNPDVPDPDLIIRTAGEMRLSNFLLWESAYAELYYSSKLWPDWDYEDLAEAVEHYQKRKRKFGGTT
ncbi:MAG: polyprenyl diphosphate synthase [Spirochaetia bacterium]